MRRLTYLLNELERLTNLMNESDKRYVERIGVESRKRDYIDQKILPVVYQDIENQWRVVTNEAERLLESNDEKCKRKNKTD